MVIRDNQIMKLMSICRRYASVCEQQGWTDDHDECKKIHREIESQQSQELRIADELRQET